MLLIPLQLCLSIANLFYGIDKGYGHSFPLWSYVLSAAYLCVVLSADGFMICVGRLELSKFVGREVAAVLAQSLRMGPVR